MKVYLVIQDVPYDSRDVVAVYAKKEDADFYADRLQRECEASSWIYSVDEFEVIGTP